MPSRRAQKNVSLEKYEKIVKTLRIVSYAALVIGIVAIIACSMLVYILYLQPKPIPFGSTLAGIDTPLTPAQLSVINNASDVNFQTAALMLLSGNITNNVDLPANRVNITYVNGKPAVIYFGSITCIFCGENRWAMALALSRFGNFSQLYNGYSSLGDSDVPTLYWTQVDYNKSGDAIGSHYTSKYITFVPVEDLNPIRGGFTLNPFETILSNVKALGNQSYVNALDVILNLSTNNATAFKGTPYTIWGAYQFSGADAIDFGNSTSTSVTSTGLPYLTYMTHQQVLDQISQPTDGFGWTEYAGADIYVASTCKTINNTAPVCSLSGIQGIEKLLK